MSQSRSAQDAVMSILSGRDKSLRARLLRGVTAIAEPFYAGAMVLRNAGFTWGIVPSHQLPRPTVSVGNITTGGTGKTPVVQWLANRLRESGRRPAVLMRGYRAAETGQSDEQQVLDRALNSTGKQPPVPIEANPNRIAGSAAVLDRRGDVDVFVLDDGFQHRRVRRDFDLVLINATAPFGFDHVLPRGLLREPMSGLRRASAFLVTRSSLVDEDAKHATDATLSRYNPSAAIFHADHVHTKLWSPTSNNRRPIDAMKGMRVFSFCGIGDPAAFELQVASHGAEHVGHFTFDDHHAYTEAGVTRIISDAERLNAACIVTTEKDWVKIAKLPQVQRADSKVCVLELGIRFHADDEEELFAQIRRSLDAVRA